MSEWFRIDSGLRQVHNVPVALQYIYMDTTEEVKMGMERRGENGDYLASCMQMTWVCMGNWKRT